MTAVLKIKVKGRGPKPGDIIEIIPYQTYNDILFPHVISQVNDDNTVTIMLLNVYSSSIPLEKGTVIADIEVITPNLMPPRRPS